MRWVAAVCELRRVVRLKGDRWVRLDWRIATVVDHWTTASVEGGSWLSWEEQGKRSNDSLWREFKFQFVYLLSVASIGHFNGSFPPPARLSALARWASNQHTCLSPRSAPLDHWLTHARTDSIPQETNLLKYALPTLLVTLCSIISDLSSIRRTNKLTSRQRLMQRKVISRKQPRKEEEDVTIVKDDRTKNKETAVLREVFEFKLAGLKGSWQPDRHKLTNRCVVDGEKICIYPVFCWLTLL